MIDDFYQAALGALVHHLDQAGAAYAVDEGEVVVNSHRLGLSIAFEGFVPQGDQMLAPVEIQIHVDGDNGDRFRVGTLGIGPDRTAAMHAAIAEWHLLVVAPLLAALGAAVEVRRAPARPVQAAGWDLFPGRVGIRGNVPPELRGGGRFFGGLMERLRQVVAKWEPPSRFELRSIFVLVTRGPEGCEVQAAVDGLLNEELTASLSELAWPDSGDAYLYKQLFVLRNHASD